MNVKLVGKYQYKNDKQFDASRRNNSNGISSGTKNEPKYVSMR